MKKLLSMLLTSLLLIGCKSTSEPIPHSSAPPPGPPISRLMEASHIIPKVEVTLLVDN